MERTCINCHFFCKEHRPEHGEGAFKLSLNEEERKRFEADPVGFDRGWYALSCYMGVWDEGVSPVSATEDDVLFSQDRGHSCFFFPNRTSMLFPAAVEMQKREESNRQLKTSYKYTVIGLWIAGIGLVLNALVTIYNAVKC